MLTFCVDRFFDVNNVNKARPPAVPALLLAISGNMSTSQRI